MKDFLCYQMMKDFGVSAPLASFISVSVNGEEWGLYLAVEGVEDSFLQRNYGSDHGELYKPDSMDFGGERENAPHTEAAAETDPAAQLLNIQADIGSVLRIQVTDAAAAVEPQVEPYLRVGCIVIEALVLVQVLASQLPQPLPADIRRFVSRVLF